jgi:multidrug transporter EmrE-like cation transporter
MTLTWGVALAVLFGAMLHASWNALVKSSTDKALDTAVIHLIGSLLGLPLLLVVGLPPRGRLAVHRGSVVIHIGYYIALTGAYRHGDLGLTYPLMRGLGPMLVALSSAVTVGEAVAAGVGGRPGRQRGVLVLGLSATRWSGPRRSPSRWPTRWSSRSTPWSMRWARAWRCTRAAARCSTSRRCSCWTAGRSACWCCSAAGAPWPGRTPRPGRHSPPSAPPPRWAPTASRCGP